MVFKDAVDKQEARVAELYEFEYEDGSFVRFTSHPRRVNFQSNDYIPIGIQRSSAEQEGVIKVGTMRVTIQLGDFTRTLIDVSKIRNQRVLDRGEIRIYQVDMTNHANYRMRFNGFTGLVQINRLALVVEFKDVFFLLKKNVPVKVFGESCNHIFGDSECTFDIDTEKVIGAADAGSDEETLIDAARTEADGFFNRGILRMTSGLRSGERATIKLYESDTFHLMPPLTGVIAPSDAYEAWPTCEKTWGGCNGFANTDNFHGFQHIPRIEQVR